MSVHWTACLKLNPNKFHKFPHLCSPSSEMFKVTAYLTAVISQPDFALSTDYSAVLWVSRDSKDYIIIQTNWTVD